MPKVHDGDDSEIADIPLSEKQLALLAKGEAITVIYHTPQMLRHLLGTRNGVFTLRKIGERFRTDEPKQVKEFADLRKAIDAAQGK